MGPSNSAQQTGEHHEQKEEIRSNACCLDFDFEEDETTGEYVFERGVDYWLPMLPAIGILWEF